MTQKALHAVRTVVRLRYAVGSVSCVLLAWELGTKAFDVPVYVMPPLSDVLRAAVDDSDLLLAQTWVTSREVVYGFLLSVCFGVVLGIAIATFRPVAKGVYPLLVSAQVVPKIAIAPLFLVWFGLGMLPKVLVAFLLSFFPIVIDTVLGLRSLEPEKLYLAQTTGAGWLRTFLKVRLPNALPTMFTGFKIAATLAVTGAMVGEFIAPGDGLGRTIVLAASELRTDLLFAGVLYISALGITTFFLMRGLERLVVGWHVSQRTASANRH